MVGRFYWDGISQPTSAFIRNTFLSSPPPAPLFPAEHCDGDNFPEVPGTLRPVTWSDIHPRDCPTNPPPGYPNNYGNSPYMETKSRLSQAWINRWTIMCLIVIAKLLLSANSLDSGLESARTESKAACQEVEVAGSALVSIPHYMAIASNDLIAGGVETSVAALVEVLDLLIVGVQEIVVFMIEMVTQTYVCLLTMAISSSLDTVLNATESIIKFVNNTVDSIVVEIDSEVDTFNSALGNVERVIESIGSFLTDGNVSFPSLSLPQLSELANLSIPSSVNDALESLRDDIPTFSEVKNITEEAIEYPFKLLRNEINQHMSGYTFNRSVLSVPSTDTITVCSDDSAIDDFFDSLSDLIHFLLKAIIIGLAVVATVSMIGTGFLDILHWQKVRRRVYILARTLRRTDKHIDPIDSFHIALGSWSSQIGLYISKPIQSLQRQVLFRWLLAYITYPPALLVLCLGLTSLVAALAQLYILNKVREESPAIAMSVGNITADISVKLQKKSEEWALDTNRALNSTQADLNDALFSWVIVATSSVNNTLNVFVDDMMSTLNDVFGNTPLYEPIKDVLDCLILFKIEGIENGLTWVQDNAHISLPRVNESIIDSAFSGYKDNSTDNDSTTDVTAVSNSTMMNATITTSIDSELADNNIATLSSAASTRVLSALTSLENNFKKAINVEFYFAGVLLSLWGIVVLMGLCRCLKFLYSEYQKSCRLKLERRHKELVQPDSTRFQHYDHSEYREEYPESSSGSNTARYKENFTDAICPPYSSNHRTTTNTQHEIDDDDADTIIEYERWISIGKEFDN
ncbi:hypothetical protein V1511DRAFT_460088 [Dipodascopsis uninucleata]